jgi:hypothetical protein
MKYSEGHIWTGLGPSSGSQFALPDEGPSAGLISRNIPENHGLIPLFLFALLSVEFFESMTVLADSMTDCEYPNLLSWGGIYKECLTLDSVKPLNMQVLVLQIFSLLSHEALKQVVATRV